MQTEKPKVIALAGNPNVGKSTVFNGLTGMKQHTGNWPGKTVESAEGICTTKENTFRLVDIPGTYSLMAHSAEEEVARNFICFSEPDAVIVVCDATCLERNLNLVLQTMEVTKNVIVCVNLMDEAKRKRIQLDLSKLSRVLSVPVVGIVARKKSSLKELTKELDRLFSAEKKEAKRLVTYAEPIEKAISIIEDSLEGKDIKNQNKRFLGLKLLDCDECLENEIKAHLGEEFFESEDIISAREEAYEVLSEAGIDKNELKDLIVSSLVKAAEEIAKGVILFLKGKQDQFDRKIDKILTGKITGYPIMLCLLALIFFLTISGANVPSGIIANGLQFVEDRLTDLCTLLHAPAWLHGTLVLGVYRVLAFVVSVMLPPMAIFFPLFTLLEDAGYLPRVAYNLDRPFKRCHACGKQALTMCMGFGCNAAGVIGCRIIDSKRERLLAILTNTFVPCNGRFPTLIAILSMFFIGTAGGLFSSFLSAALLTLVILVGILTTFFVTKILSKTLLKGEPSSFTLELPPYRRPQFLKVLVRSVFDRTIKVLFRAIIVAAPAGLVIFLMANVKISEISLLSHCASFLDPFAKLMGLDGVILLSFILGFPANEIVVPIVIMAYMSKGSILELESLTEMKALFVQNGFTTTTAISMMLFSLMHWPCSTTLLTIKKETGSMKWTILAAAIPTVLGVVLCILFTSAVKLFSGLF